jgi:hypothetical protein
MLWQRSCQAKIAANLYFCAEIHFPQLVALLPKVTTKEELFLGAGYGKDRWAWVVAAKA